MGIEKKMDDDIIYFITGANKGIGLHLTRALLLRENTTVVATKRTSATPSLELEDSIKAENSRLIVIPLSSDTNGSDLKERDGTVEDLAQRLGNEGVRKIDVLILNAGAATSFQSASETSVQELQAHFQINTIWPIEIYQTLRPLLLAGSQKKLIYISSSLGSIAGMDDATYSLAYGISKAGANYFVRKVHFEEEGNGVVSLAVHPGWVKTHNGQAFADSVGVKEPPMSVEESVNGVLSQIDTATRETTSGSFVSYNGAVIPW